MFECVELKNYKITTRFSRTHKKEMEYAEGNVYNDNRFEDGEYIYTSAIVYRSKDGKEIKTTSGSMYVLVD